MRNWLARKKMARWCYWAARNTGAIHYAETRPIPLARGVRKELPLTTDCSGFSTIAARYAGLPDPNGQSYSGYGYTGTLLGHLAHITRRQARRGDLVVYGDYPGEHVVVLLQSPRRHADPLVASHGQESDPAIYRLSAETAYFRAGTTKTYLRITP